jgi:hypothetical protein
MDAEDVGMKSADLPAGALVGVGIPDQCQAGKERSASVQRGIAGSEQFDPVALASQQLSL